MEEIEIYTDGGCRGNPGIGAYAAIIYRNGTQYASYGDYYDNTTNNEMEASALLIALKFVSDMTDVGNKFKYVIYSDSAYAVNTYNDWLDGWISSDRIKWKQNRDIWHQVYTLKRKIQHDGTNLSVVKVKGHSGVPKNVEVDKLVNKFMDEKRHTDLLNKKLDLQYQAEKNYSTDDEKPELHTEVSEPSIKTIINVSNIRIEGDSVIVESEATDVIIPKSNIISILNELGLELKV